MIRRILPILSLAAAGVALASSPSWWGFTVNPDVNSNYAPANLGQLKYMAAKAKMHLDASLFGGAGSDIDDLIAGFGPANGSTYTQAELDANYAPANLGQIKYVARPFYDRMNAAGFDAIGYPKTNRGLSEAWAYAYPWNPSTAVDDN